jgi:adenylate cyclase
MERRLTAILAADVVGYSRLMAGDEAGTLNRLQSLLQDVIGPKIETYQGRTVKLMGDGLLADFSSTVNAVTCAVELQHAVSEREQSRAEDERICLRVGINLGDIIIDNNDIFGDGVNVAARLESIAEPAGIAISHQVYSSLPTEMRSLFADCGERELKNMTLPVRVWHWPETLNNPQEVADLDDDDAVPIIAVERFSQPGNAEEDADIAAELQAEILDSLSHRVGIKVISAGEPATLPTYLLKGRCRVSANRCRLYLSMTVVANGETFWSAKYDSEIDDIFDFIDEAVAKTSTALRAHFNAFAGAKYASHPDHTLTVQQLLAKAAFFFYHFDAPNAELSRKTMAIAVAKAATNPMAVAMQSYAIMQTVPLAIDWIEDIDSDTALSLADKSVNLGANIDFIFHNRANVRLWLRRDHPGCFADARRALEINPSYHLAREDIAIAEIFGGDRAKGLRQLEALIQQVPAEPITPYRLSILSIGLALAGDMEAARRHAKDGYERKPQVPIHAIAYAVSAAGDESVTGSRQFEELIKLHGLSASDAKRFPFTSGSDTNALADMLRQAGVPE